MDSAYNHKEYEEKIYKLWEEANAFAANPDSSKKPYCIIMPPPNANDPLHIGHAMFVTIEDVLIRYHRMLGESSLWLPGTDHAGIETQFVFEKKLAKEDKSRFDFDRETFYKMVWEYVEQNSKVAINQMKRLGASADWSKYKFTLDPLIINFVLDTFNKLHNDGLVYRDERLINYCIKCGTGYSELEVEYEERTDALYFVRYKLKHQSEEYIVVATTRPEPIWADTHLAVNPKDDKNKNLIGKFVLNPLTNESMEIIGDEFVDPEFGTGIVKLTPAHDPNDFEVAQNKGLPIVHAIGTDGKMLGGPSKGKKIIQARQETIEYLKNNNLIEKINEKYDHRVGTCYRCHSIIEPIPLPQFFVKVKPLTQKALEALDNGETKILGAGREAILRHWLNNLKDWNISRQIVWGIRIPVWYNVTQNPNMRLKFLDKENKIVVGTANELIKNYQIEEIKNGLQTLTIDKNAEYIVSKQDPGSNYIQETDTFDTWFSSGQWPVATLKVNSEKDFDYFYPTSVMETAYDILERWVLRMMMMGIYLTNNTPFKFVYLHGLIRDEKGQKMSKSIGNVINPLDVSDKYGTDALRMALIMSTSAGTDKNVGESQIKGMRNFSNKIWNASRYVLTKESEKITNGEYDSAFTEKLNLVVSEISGQLDNLKIGLASETAYNEFWHWYCDICIEKNKSGELSDELLLNGLKTFLILLHPFVPFVTEAIWVTFNKNLLITSPWPTK